MAVSASKQPIQAIDQRPDSSPAPYDVKRSAESGAAQTQRSGQLFYRRQLPPTAQSAAGTSWAAPPARESAGVRTISSAISCQSTRTHDSHYGSGYRRWLAAGSANTHHRYSDSHRQLPATILLTGCPDHSRRREAGACRRLKIANASASSSRWPADLFVRTGGRERMCSSKFMALSRRQTAAVGHKELIQFFLVVCRARRRPVPRWSAGKQERQADAQAKSFMHHRGYTGYRERVRINSLRRACGRR